MRLTVISTARHIWPTILKINLIFDTLKKINVIWELKSKKKRFMSRVGQYSSFSKGLLNLEIL